MYSHCILHLPRERKQTNNAKLYFHVADLRAHSKTNNWLLFLFCFDVFNFVLSRRLNLTLYLFDARHVDMRHTTGSSDMSYVACPCPGHVVDRRSWLQACSACSRLHTIGLQLCRHGMGARLIISVFGIWASERPYRAGRARECVQSSTARRTFPWKMNEVHI